MRILKSLIVMLVLVLTISHAEKAKAGTIGAVGFQTVSEAVAFCNQVINRTASSCEWVYFVLPGTTLHSYIVTYEIIEHVENSSATQFRPYDNKSHADLFCSDALAANEVNSCYSVPVTISGRTWREVRIVDKASNNCTTCEIEPPPMALPRD